MKGDRWGQVRERVGVVKEDTMFLARGVQRNLNMSFGARILPREALWGVQSAADKGV